MPRAATSQRAARAPKALDLRLEGLEIRPEHARSVARESRQRVRQLDRQLRHGSGREREQEAVDEAVQRDRELGVGARRADRGREHLDEVSLHSQGVATPSLLEVVEIAGHAIDPHCVHAHTLGSHFLDEIAGKRQQRARLDRSLGHREALRSNLLVGEGGAERAREPRRHAGARYERELPLPLRDTSRGHPPGGRAHPDRASSGRGRPHEEDPGPGLESRCRCSLSRSSGMSATSSLPGSDRRRPPVLAPSVSCIGPQEEISCHRPGDDEHEPAHQRWAGPAAQSRPRHSPRRHPRRPSRAPAPRPRRRRRRTPRPRPR